MKRICITTFVLACLALAAKAEEGGVDSLLQVITENNLELKALKAQYEAELLQQKGENGIAGPSVEYSPFYTKGYHGMASSELVVSQEFEFPTTYVMRSRQIRMMSHTQEEDYEAARRSIMLQARLLCLDITMQNQIVELLTERTTQSRMTSELLQRRMEAGDANMLDVNKAKLELMQAEKELAEAGSERIRMMQDLQVLNGGKEISVANCQLPEIQLQQQYPLNLGDLPEVKAAETSLQAAIYNESVSRNSWLPSISLGYRRNTEEHTRLNGFLVGASFPIWNTRHRVQAARQQRISSETRLESTKIQAERELTAKREQLRHLAEVLNHNDTNLLRETLPLLDKALQYGQITALQYYAERDDIYQKLLSHIRIHAQYAKLYAEVYQR